MSSKNKFIFRCPACGEYNVSPRTFEKFAGAKRWQMLEVKLAGGAWGGVIIFDNYCPKCQSTGQSTGEVRALWPKPEA